MTATLVMRLHHQMGTLFQGPTDFKPPLYRQPPYGPTISHPPRDLCFESSTSHWLLLTLMLGTLYIWWRKFFKMWHWVAVPKIFLPFTNEWRGLQVANCTRMLKVQPLASQFPTLQSKHMLMLFLTDLQWIFQLS